MVECALNSQACFGDDRQSVWRRLVGRMAMGEPAALGDLYDQSSAILYPLALRMLRTPEDAEEVLHDVYARAWRTAGSYAECRSTVISWLILMTRTMSIDRLRAMRRHSKTHAAFDAEFDTSSPGPTPEASAAGRERQSRLRSALTSLPPEHRQLIELAFFGGLTYYEVAETTGLPVGTVKTRIRTTLFRLRSGLEDLAR